jgi:hypothetical protein
VILFVRVAITWKVEFFRAEVMAVGVSSSREEGLYRETMLHDEENAEF